jgi:phage-related protein (TIGR01555 family)
MQEIEALLHSAQLSGIGSGQLGPVRTHLDGMTGFQGFDSVNFSTNPGRPGVGWANAATGMGTPRDKTTYGVFHGYSPIDLISLSNLYHGSDLASRIIDVPADEAFRLPYKVSVGSEALDKRLAEMLEHLAVRERFLESCVWGRLFGGAWTVLGVDDGQPASEPLNTDRANEVQWLQVVDRRFMWPISWYNEGPKAGTPEKYTLSQTWVGVANGAYTIHESRMIKWPGVRTAQRERNMNASYDYSVLDKCWPQLRMFETLWKGVELLIVEGPQAVYTVNGFAEKLMANQGQALLTRMQMVDFYRSVLRAIVIDKDETFERQPMSLSGIPELLSQAAFRIAATAQIPMLVLFGQDAAGFSTGDSSLRWFWDKTKAYQTNTIGPRICELCRTCLEIWGSGDYADKLVVTFEPLYTPSALERAQEIQAMSAADNAYVQMQALTPEEIVLSRFTDQNTWSDSWKVDLETRKKLLADIIKNLTEGAKPGAPEQGDVGSTPTAKDVRGFAVPEVLPTEVAPNNPGGNAGKPKSSGPVGTKPAKGKT